MNQKSSPSPLPTTTKVTTPEPNVNDQAEISQQAQWTQKVIARYQQFIVASQYLIPQHVLSLLAGVFANCKITWIKNYLISRFIRHFSVDLAEAKEPRPYKYPSFNAFFTRELQPETRPIATKDHIISSPADGRITQVGKTEMDTIIQAKGRVLHLDSLLGYDLTRTSPFRNGHYINIYLAPHNYHRVHAPISGTLKETIYIPGKLFSVNDLTTSRVNDLYSRNERLIIVLETIVGPVAIILIGALLVGSIQTIWPNTINKFKRCIQITNFELTKPSIPIKKGDYIGHFAMGSTVVLLLPRGRGIWHKHIKVGMTLKYGSAIGEISKDAWKDKSLDFAELHTFNPLSIFPETEED